MSLVFVFIDGLGIGRQDAETNPLAAFEPRVLRLFQDRLGPFPSSGRCLPTDAAMGVEGLPQSATGHAALWTGENAAQLLGRHLTGFPNQQLRELVESRSLFLRLKRRGLQPVFANAYRPEFFQRRPNWVSASTLMCESSGVPLLTLDDLRKGRALYMDFTNLLLRRMGFDVPLRTPSQAAQVLLEIARPCDLCFYEYFLTDIVGHRGTFEEAAGLLETLDEFLFNLVKGLEPEQSLIITSDHGNIEAMDHSRHTANSVPTLLWGPISSTFPPPGEGLEIVEIAGLVERFLLAALTGEEPAT